VGYKYFAIFNGLSRTDFRIIRLNPFVSVKSVSYFSQIKDITVEWRVYLRINSYLSRLAHLGQAEFEAEVEKKFLAGSSPAPAN
jgi:hypothetical protein